MSAETLSFASRDCVRTRTAPTTVSVNRDIPLNLAPLHAQVMKAAESSHRLRIQILEIKK